jgi:hypothetical protein
LSAVDVERECGIMKRPKFPSSASGSESIYREAGEIILPILPPLMVFHLSSFPHSWFGALN